MFEGLNIRYFGPTDGHDVVYLVNILKDLKKIKGPKLLHVITVKGKGFKVAEENQTAWHAVGKRFDIHTGEFLDKPDSEPHAPRFQDVFGKTIVELAERNDKILGISPAMLTGCGMNYMMEVMPHRTFDVGIAEQHAVTFSAGLAISGYVPFCNIYSTFAQRAYDQIVHDVALQKLNVVFCFDRAGLVGADGATHHGAFDIPMLRHVPNITIASPYDELELRNLMYTAQLPDKGPFVIRYPRGRGSRVEWQLPMQEIEIGTARLMSEGTDVVYLTLGPLGTRVAKVVEMLKAQGISAAHYDMRFAKPLDTKVLHEVLSTFKRVITVEDGAVAGGFGSAVVEFANEHGYRTQIKLIGLPDRFVAHGQTDELFAQCGMDLQSIANAATELASWSSTPTSSCQCLSGDFSPIAYHRKWPTR